MRFPFCLDPVLAAFCILPALYALRYALCAMRLAI